MPAILAALCLRLSATTPTPHSALLKTKAKVQFDRPVKRLSKRFFYVFQQSKSDSISALFFGFDCPVGRGSQNAQNTKRNGFPLRKCDRSLPVSFYYSKYKANKSTEIDAEWRIFKDLFSRALS